MNANIDEAIEHCKAARKYVRMAPLNWHVGFEREIGLCLNRLEAAKLARRGGAEPPEPISLKVGEMPNRPIIMSEYIAGLEKERKAQAEEIERLTADLNKYGGHTDDCEMDFCTCGWEQTERGLKKTRSPGLKEGAA